MYKVSDTFHISIFAVHFSAIRKNRFVFQRFFCASHVRVSSGWPDACRLCRTLYIRMCASHACSCAVSISICFSHFHHNNHNNMCWNDRHLNFLDFSLSLSLIFYSYPAVGCRFIFLDILADDRMLWMLDSRNNVYHNVYSDTRLFGNLWSFELLLRSFPWFLV